MVTILTLLALISVAVGVFCTRDEHDYGISLMGWTLVFGFSTVLHIGIEPSDASSFYFHHEFFEKVTMATGVIAFIAILVLSLLVTANTNRDRKEQECLKEDLKRLREAQRATKDALGNRRPVIIDVKRNP